MALDLRQRFTYGVGHVLNDLCASIWFSYLLVFLQQVNGFSTSMAGIILLIGQVTDALATPIIGIQSDNSKGLCNYGKRKSWHLLGTICVCLSFPLLFVPCHHTICRPETSELFKLIYFLPVVVVFQIGWASTQIAHLSLIPDLASSESEKIELNAIRYAWTVVANIAVYVTTWVLLGVAGDVSNDVSHNDAHIFLDLSIIVVVVGLVFSVIFHIGTSEGRQHSEDYQTLDATGSPSPDQYDKHRRHYAIKWWDWFRDKQFYQVGVLYMCTRLVVNVSQVYIPMYLTQSLQLNKEYIAVVPLLVYVSGFLATLLLKCSSNTLGNKLSYLGGAVAVLASCVWLYFPAGRPDQAIVGVAVLLGAGGTTITVSSLSMTASLIGHHKNTSAFVYGATSFVDKLANGIAVVLIQHLYPCVSDECCDACPSFYRDVIVYGTAFFALLGLLTLCTLGRNTIGVPEVAEDGADKSLSKEGVTHEPDFVSDDSDVPSCNGNLQKQMLTTE